MSVPDGRELNSDQIDRYEIAQTRGTLLRSWKESLTISQFSTVPFPRINSR